MNITLILKLNKLLIAKSIFIYNLNMNLYKLIIYRLLYLTIYSINVKEKKKWVKPLKKYNKLKYK